VQDVFTFLFTDIEGSTQQWERYGDLMRDVLDAHDAIFDEIVARNGGVLLSHTGDGISARFAEPSQAVEAAVEAQRRLRSLLLPSSEPLGVRMGIHQGPVIRSGGRDLGPTLNRSARLMSAAHGGQVLASDEVKRHLRPVDISDYRLIELGWHHLRDVPDPVLVHQLVAAGLPSTFPPLRTVDGHQHNLPQPISSFVGRLKTLEAVSDHLKEHRLVSLVGIGGSGKSRLAVEVAATRVRRHSDGVWLVELADIDSDDAVAAAIGRALRIQEQPGRALADTVLDRVQDTDMLLVMDNCEHVLTGTRSIAKDLLSFARGVRILTTSRMRLGIAGEAVWHVAPLSVVDSLESQAEYESEAVELFLERARLSAADVKLSAEDLPTIRRLCRALDGLPLAIELAAARVRVLSLRQIEERLADRFGLLAEGSGWMPRQRTLKATIDWSYELLTARQREACNRLSVFRGTFDIEAAARLLDLDQLAIVETLTELVDHSLVQVVRNEAQTRFRMLETMRAYGHQRLEQEGALLEVRDRHRSWVLDLASRPLDEHLAPNGPAWHNELDADLPNVLFAIESGLIDRRAEDSLQLCARLWLYFWLRGHLSEGRSLCERALEAASDADASLLAPVLLGTGLLAFAQLDPEDSGKALDRALRLAEATSQEANAGWAHIFLAVIAAARGERDTAHRHLLPGVEIASKLPSGTLAGALYWASSVSSMLGEDEEAAKYLDRSIALARKTPSPYVLTRFLPVLAKTQLADGNENAAVATFEEAVEVARQTADRAGMARALTALAELYTTRGEYVRARSALDEAIPIVSREIDDRIFACKVELALAEVDRHHGEYKSAQLHLRRSLEAGRRLTDWKSSTDPFRAHAELLIDLGDLDQALRQLDESERHARDARHTERLCRTLLLREEVLAMSGRSTTSVPDEVVALCALIVSPAIAATLDHLRGRVALESGENREAVAHLTQAMGARIEAGHALSAVETAEQLSRALTALGHTEVATRLLAAADAERAQLGTPVPPGLEHMLAVTRRALQERLGDSFAERWKDGATAGLAIVVAGMTI
jgi:predicted ATPase/class 3 adenylate cyclase